MGKKKKNLYFFSEAIKCSALAFQGVDNIHRGDCLSLGVFCKGDGLANRFCQKLAKDARFHVLLSWWTTDQLINTSMQALDASSSG